jgi:DNA (cytosine-5)-methyltransferase 1
VARRSLVSLFSGAGGLDYGFEAAGFETRLALDVDADCCASLAASRPWPVLQRNLSTLSPRELLSAAGVRRGELDVLIGGPPCQPFSKSGFWRSYGSRRLADPRAKALGAFMRVVKEVQPAVFLIENVRGLKFVELDQGFSLLLRRIRQINRETGSAYTPHYAVLNAAQFGVPQLRERLFLVAARDGSKFQFPNPTHGAGLLPFRTAWDAIGDLKAEGHEELAVSGKWAELLPSIPEGQNYLWHTARGGGIPLFGWRRRYWTFLLKLAKHQPSWTIQANPGPSCGPFHWQNRRLSIHELCRLQTFPDDVEIVGSQWSRRRQVGNAVPSLLAEVIAKEIRVQLLGGRRRKEPPRLLPPDRGTPPRRERARPVAETYHHLIGVHAEHPGEGRGAGALARLVA